MKRQEKLRLLLAFVLLVANTFPGFNSVASAALRGSSQQATAATAWPKGIERVTSVEGITEYRLANGLRVLMFPDQTKQTITVNITYLVARRRKIMARPAWPTCSNIWSSKAPPGIRTFLRN